MKTYAGIGSLKYITILTFLGMSHAYGSDMERFVDASNSMCQKVKSCALESMQKEEDLTPQMRAMMEGMLEGMCTNIKEYADVGKSHSLLKPAAQCLESMSALSCGAFESDAMAETKECREFEQKRARYEKG